MIHRNYLGKGWLAGGGGTRQGRRRCEEMESKKSRLVEAETNGQSITVINSYDRGNHENQRISEFRVKSKRCPYWLERNQVSGQDVTEWNRYRDEECLLAIESSKKGKK
jgi:hypothetical protein